ncbi:DNA polymerase III subunit gamma/tau [Limosilactobacillus coleohominis]|uniref:DNA-directed DNA polymerase n=1 Tax=Limosilactobacillus coleohominis TaxID=181675 RepID=A0ABS2GYK1_9LACO|nr:DNA polymerase III subunit gamma/tau [Limosilactobacillus coleohominis]MBM6940444.1 DNA polymerase III subunit gamma/tau [Limosilactobacillus coleohominis]MBM6955181.1 DNA polymerase III subunit gamma/tau [Limosilactobacillus coleohominis]
MSYQALYRVWRPQRFDDVVGQQVITQTLKNAIITNQISHAYLFAGPRGTGKTSAAKIFAKAVNCHHQKNGEPCNQCEICQAITDGTLNDVIEIDAASNNGVEEIRDIRDKAKYAPTQADYKVYIIDEVHMLSTGAFNALLKTLEEPPANVIFILATTEPHKIPLTILSRVQRFDFHRISPQDIFDRMKYILDEKQFKYEDKALWVIANAAEGGMRDALSILDQVLSFSDDHVKLDDALLVTGSVTKKLMQSYFMQVVQHQSPEALKTMDQILEQGKDGQRFIEDLISFIRDILLYQESPDLIQVASTGLKDEDFQTLSQLASAQLMYQMIDILNQVQDEMRFTTHPDVYLEVLTIRLSQIDDSQQEKVTNAADERELTRLKQQVEKLQQLVKQLQQPGGTQPKTVKAQKRRENTGVQPVRINLEQVYRILDHATKQDLIDLQNMWPDVLNMLNPAYRSLLELSKPVAASPDGVVVSFDNGFLLQKASVGSLADNINQGLEKITGSERHVVFVPSAKWPQIRHDFLADRGYFDKQKGSQVADPVKEPAKKEQDQITKQATQMFGSADVEIKDD